jgi:hypothetical protein
MNQEKLHVIRSDRGSCLTTISSMVLVFLAFLLWIAVANFVRDNWLIARPNLLEANWLILFSALLGFVLHELCQYTFFRLFGSSPRYSGRNYDEKRTHLQRKYLFPVIMRFWSPGKRFSLAQYLVIVLSPVLLTFGLLPIAMIAWQNPEFQILIFVLGFISAALIAFDILIAVKLVTSGGFDYDVVDESEGTYRVKG